MSKVTAAVKATLVGTQEEELAVSQQIKTNFIQHARKDESSGELYMTEDEFIDAIAPKHQDYVSEYIHHISMLSLIECVSTKSDVINMESFSASQIAGDWDGSI